MPGRVVLRQWGEPVKSSERGTDLRDWPDEQVTWWGGRRLSAESGGGCEGRVQGCAWVHGVGLGSHDGRTEATSQF